MLNPDENPATIQIVSLLTLLFVLGMLIFSNISSTSHDLVSTFPNTTQNLISNPQVDALDVPILDAETPAMPVAMFNLDNPNRWEAPETVTLIGTFQSELGCESDLQIDCDATAMTYDILGDIWQTSFELPAGTYQYRLHLNHSETHIYGKNGTSGANSFPIDLVLDTPQTVNFYYDHKTGWITDNINSLILTLTGNFQDKVGCRGEWEAHCFRTWMQDLEGDGIYTYETLLIPEGSWEVRIALDGNIKTSYGQYSTFDDENIPLWIPNIGHLSVFTWDSHQNTFTPFISNIPIRLSTELPQPAPNQ